MIFRFSWFWENLFINSELKSLQEPHYTQLVLQDSQKTLSRSQESITTPPQKGKIRSFWRTGAMRGSTTRRVVNRPPRKSKLKWFSYQVRVLIDCNGSFFEFLEWLDQILICIGLLSKKACILLDLILTLYCGFVFNMRLSTLFPFLLLFFFCIFSYFQQKEYYKLSRDAISRLCNWLRFLMVIN